MKKQAGGNKELDSYIESVKASQRNTTWPDLLRGGRSVDEYLFKGARNAPLVQRIGAIVLGLSFVMIGVATVDFAYQQREWFISALAVIFIQFRRIVHPQRISVIDGRVTQVPINEKTRLPRSLKGPGFYQALS